MQDVFLILGTTLGILFPVSPHKNIKKATDDDVLAENVFRANGEKFSSANPRCNGISIIHFAEHRIDRKAPKQQCYLGPFLWAFPAMRINVSTSPYFSVVFVRDCFGALVWHIIQSLS